MTTFEKTWVQQVNTSMDNSTIEGTRSKILFTLKDMLCAAGAGQWTVHQSSNGTNAANDATYAWTSAAHVVFEDTGAWHASDGSVSAGGNHSWCVLKSPDDYPTSGKNIYLTIDAANHDHSANTGGRCQIFVSTAAPGTDGAVNKRPTLDPTKTYSWHSWNMSNTGNYSDITTDSVNSTNYGGQDGMVFDPGYDASHVTYFHGARSNGSGSLAAGCFFFHCSREGYGWPTGGGFMSTLDTQRAAGDDPWPLVMGFGNYTPAPGFFDVVGDDHVSNATYGQSVGGEYTASRGNDAIMTFSYDGTVTGTIYTDTYLAGLAGKVHWYDHHKATASGVDSKQEAAPIFVHGALSGPRRGIIGRIHDLKHGGRPYVSGGDTAGVAQATVEPASGTVESVYLGAWWWPLNAVPTV